MAAKEFGVEPKYRVASRPLIKLAGFFDQNTRESYEMLYQYDSAYLFESTKFSKAVGFESTSYPEGVRRVAATYVSAIA